MDRETVVVLLECLDQKQYSDTIRFFAKQNKRMRISGYSSLERVPIKLIANRAKTDKSFCIALLDSISTTILSGWTIDLEMDISDIKGELPKSQWIGLAAYLLLRDGDKYATTATELIYEYNEIRQLEFATSEKDEYSIQGTTVTKSEKKEDKFREKYLSAKNQIATLTLDLERLKKELHEAQIEIVQLRKEQETCKIKEIQYDIQIDTLSKENIRLLGELQETQQKLDGTKCVPCSKPEVQVFAPNCEDILEKYSSTISFDFKGKTSVSFAEDFDTYFDTYDEIWLFSDVLPFGVLRKLYKLKQCDNMKVHIFQSATDLVSHAEKLIRNK